MKHLKTYKTFESFSFSMGSDALNHIGDILHGMEDDGFEVNYYQNSNYTINIDITYKNGKKFKWSDISDTIEHVDNYLKEYFYQLVEMQYEDSSGIECFPTSLGEMEGEVIRSGGYDCILDMRITYGNKYEARSLKRGAGGYLAEI